MLLLSTLQKRGKRNFSEEKKGTYIALHQTVAGTPTANMLLSVIVRMKRVFSIREKDNLQ